MARRARRRSRSTGASTLVKGPLGASRLEKQVFQLMRARTMPAAEAADSDAYELARGTIKRIVFDSNDRRISSGDKLLFLLSTNLSAASLPGYATLDASHIRRIGTLIAIIERYVDDGSQRRPLSLLMLASPGAGKSHFIRCIANRLRSRNVAAITFNMAGLQTHDDLIPPLDAARNAKVEDQVPLLFLDEFDSRPSNIPLLLPMLWDGELTLGQRDLKLGKVIVVLAGSDPVLPVTMDEARSMRQALPTHQNDTPKLVDLLSRINGGVVSIPPFYDTSRDIDRRPDKVCVAVHLLRQRFGRSLRSAPLALFRFIARADFRYGVRSIAHLIDLIPHRQNAADLAPNELKLPVGSVKTLKDSSLAYHLHHEEQVHGIVNLWKEVGVSDAAVPVFLEAAEFAPIGLPEDFMPLYLERMANEINAIPR